MVHCHHQPFPLPHHRIQIQIRSQIIMQSMQIEPIEHRFNISIWIIVPHKTKEKKNNATHFIRKEVEKTKNEHVLDE